MSVTRTLIVISALFLNITVFFVLKNIFDFRVSVQEEEKLRKLGVTIFENARPIRSVSYTHLTLPTILRV